MAKYTIVVGNALEGTLSEEFESEFEGGALKQAGLNALMAQGVETFGWVIDNKETCRELAESALTYATRLGLTIADESGEIVLSD